MLDIWEGIPRANEFLDRFSTLRSLSSPISLGMIPSKLFFETSMDLKVDRILYKRRVQSLNVTVTEFS
jgi:hypothetical protein